MLIAERAEAGARPSQCSRDRGEAERGLPGRVPDGSGAPAQVGGRASVSCRCARPRTATDAARGTRGTVHIHAEGRTTSRNVQRQIRRVVPFAYTQPHTHKHDRGPTNGRNRTTHMTPARARDLVASLVGSRSARAAGSYPPPHCVRPRLVANATSARSPCARWQMRLRSPPPRDRSPIVLPARA